MIRLGGGLLAVAFTARIVQLWHYPIRTTGWLLLELSRWTLHLAIALIAIHVVNKLSRELMDHRERLARIEAEARVAKAQLDADGPRDYLEVVGG